MPESTPFIIYMNFLVASAGFYGGECIRKMSREDILPSGNVYLLLQKLLIQLLRQNSLKWSALALAGRGNL